MPGFRVLVSVILHRTGHQSGSRDLRCCRVPPSAIGGPENLRFHAVSKCLGANRMVVNQPFGGSRHGRQRIRQTGLWAGRIANQTLWLLQPLCRFFRPGQLNSQRVFLRRTVPPLSSYGKPARPVCWPARFEQPSCSSWQPFGCTKTLPWDRITVLYLQPRQKPTKDTCNGSSCCLSPSFSRHLSNSREPFGNERHSCRLPRIRLCYPSPRPL